MNEVNRKQNLTARAQRVLEIEAQAIHDLVPTIGTKFVDACELCMQCAGRVVVTGMGKSGHIAGKIAATLASTGTPAFFVHPGEASHGDLGMITPKDLVIAVSNSGETAEIITILPLLKRLGVPLITMTGTLDSTLGNAATVVLSIAVAHPGGSLGRRLLLHVEDLMHTDDEIPSVAADTPLADGLLEMTQKRLGMTAVVTPSGHLQGIFTDGDLRRALGRNLNVHETLMQDVMTTNCKTVRPDQLAAEVVRIMEQQKITALLVTDEDELLVGALNVHDFFRAGVM